MFIKKIINKEFKNITLTEKIAYFGLVLFALSLFLSKAALNISFFISFSMFLLCYFNNRTNNKKVYFDKRIVIFVFGFVLLPMIVYFLKNNLGYDEGKFLKYLMFFPLVYFLKSKVQFCLFFIFSGISGLLSLITALLKFIITYKDWIEVKFGVVYSRIAVAFDAIAYANIISIFLLVLIGFFIFYSGKIKKKNIFLISCVILLGFFILIINRSRIVYFSFLPALMLLIFFKNKFFGIIVPFLAIIILFALPNDLTGRLKFIKNSDPSTNLRILFWKGSLESIKKKPFLGQKPIERKFFLDNYFSTILVEDKDYITNEIKEVTALEYINKWHGNLKTSDGKYVFESHNAYLQMLMNFGLLMSVPIFMFIFLFIPYILIFEMQKDIDVFFSLIKKIMIPVYICLILSGVTEIIFRKQIMIFVWCIFFYVLNFLITQKRVESN